MLPVLLLALAAAPAPSYDLRLGLSAAEWQGLVSNTLGHVARGYVITQELHTPGGDSLVRWSSTPELDPKGPNALGLQMYGPDGTFRRWLPDTARIDRDFVLCGRFLVGGVNTLRVWDTEQNYAVMARRVLPGPLRYAHLKCQKSGVSVEGIHPLNHPTGGTVLRFTLPALLPLPALP